MDRFDVISHLSKWKHKTYGPFTAYRNIPEFTELFRLIEADLYETLNTPEFYSIDEWGHFPHDELNQFTDVNYPRSMSNVIEKYSEAYSIRIGGSGTPGWDGKPNFDYCVWTIRDGQSTLLLKNTGRAKERQEVSFCHYEYSKHTAAKLLLEMTEKDRLNILFNATSIMWSKHNGLILPA